ncbi:MAG TPA: acetolactate synthase large subunit [Microvirga sp.]|jgi:acetolactate synthase-1/2/3 large subunit
MTISDEAKPSEASEINGAESLVRTLVTGGVEVCFANPGTSEMHFVAALDQVEGIRSILCLFEGVATGAADGYARMAGKPAATLLHLGPGLANGLANLHNAKRARSSVINIVGEHATFHRRFDAPLTSDIEALAQQYSGWLRTSENSRMVAADGAEAIAAALTPPGHIATLVLPADTAWGAGGPVATVSPVPSRATADQSQIAEAVEALRQGSRTLLLLGDRSLRADGLALVARIAQKTGARYLAQTSNARMERGAGRLPIERVPYPVDAAVQALADFDAIILVGATPPVAFFGYPGKPSELAPAQCRFVSLAEPHEDQIEALSRLAEAVAAPSQVQLPAALRPELPPDGPLNPASIAAVLGALIPEQAIVCDESVTTGRLFFGQTHGARPHDWLQLTGGSIGLGIPLATGAAVACPDRKVIALQADGSGLYTVQGLWTQAREKLSILTCIWSNRSYAILRGELAAVGARNPGPRALDMLSLDNPSVDWVSLAHGFGMEARRVSTVREFAEAFREGLKPGPYLIEVLLDG